jgi:hypothetical protein
VTLFQQRVAERVDRCLARPERLSLGEVEILRCLLARVPKISTLRFAEEQEIQKIERKLGFTPEASL